ncbi:MAG: sigma-70 family RNA polymerase sigma factor [bacterium]|nr:sigma-70 family RNA polymerase sigma factor [bacterium]
MDSIENALIKRAKKGDIQSFTTLVEMYKDKIYNYLFRLTSDRQDAYDLSQETFLRVYTHLDSFNDEARFSPWIYQIASNLGIDHLRKRRAVLYLDEPIGAEGTLLTQLPSKTPDPSEQVATGDLQDAVEKSLQCLADEYRIVLVLRYVQELSYEEIAAALQLPVTTVKTRLFRARVGLRARLMTQGFFNS